MILIISNSIDAALGFTYLLIPSLPIAMFMAFHINASALTDDLLDEPRPTPRWMIPVWCVIYSLPGAGLYMLMLDRLFG